MSQRIPVAYLKPGEAFTYRLMGAAGSRVGTAKRVDIRAGGGTVVILTDGTRLTFDAGQYVIRTAVAS